MFGMHTDPRPTAAAMTTVPVGDAKERLEELIDAATRGEDVVVSTGDGASVRLMPVPESVRRARQGGGARGLIVVEDGFDDPIPGFEPYM